MVGFSWPRVKGKLFLTVSVAEFKYCVDLPGYTDKNTHGPQDLTLLHDESINQCPDISRGCPACRCDGRPLGFDLERIPTNSVRLHLRKELARHTPTGDLCLYFCPACGFIWNARYDPANVDYSPGYEATQAFSPTYQHFLERQVTNMVREQGICGQTVLEIGCGNGEFLAAICTAGGNTGIGYDPVFDPLRAPPAPKGQYTVYPELFTAATPLDDVDVVICRNTLEHIAPVLEFVTGIRTAIGSRQGIRLVFQVPAWERIVEKSAFWDVYYEHCSYFTAHSLKNLFRTTGFDVTGVGRIYDGQYLIVLADAADVSGQARQSADTSFNQDSTAAGERFSKARQDWIGTISTWRRRRQKAVLWGGGSKAVAFLSGVGQPDAIAAAVDINPHKQGTFLPASGLPVIGPHELVSVRPEKIILMNAIYQQEVRNQLRDLGIDAELISLE